MRIDKYLFENKLAKSRTRAAEMISQGIVFANGKQVTKPSFEITDETVTIQGETLKYVSRGGLKLEAALSEFQISPQGMTAIDFGASTGGFTDCLLQNNCAKVFAIDSGSNQLDESLKNDPRVVSIENFNARYLEFSDINQLCDLAVCDVSFISQTLLYPAVTKVLKNEGHFISLIKPQFEVGKANIGKGGIVKSEKARADAIEFIKISSSKYNLILEKIITSPICGGDGNIEYLALFSYLRSRKSDTEGE